MRDEREKIEEFLARAEQDFAVRVGYGLNREPAAWVERC
jgi:hypothetical protein